MPEKCQTLTASQINYLITLFRLNSGDTGIRCVDIAKALEITKPSVHTMMKTLSAMMLVRKTKYGNVFLSEDGKNTAEQYNEYYRTVCDYFEKSLCLSQRQAQRSALAVLSELSAEDIQNMCEQINKTREGTLNVS